MKSRKEVRRLVKVIADHIEAGTIFQSGILSRAELAGYVRQAEADMGKLESVCLVQPLENWAEADGPVLWWRLPVSEEPYVGTPLDTAWPGGHTHWTVLPVPSIS